MAIFGYRYSDPFNNFFDPFPSSMMWDPFPSLFEPTVRTRRYYTPVYVVPQRRNLRSSRQTLNSPSSSSSKHEMAKFEQVENESQKVVPCQNTERVNNNNNNNNNNEEEKEMMKKKREMRVSTMKDNGNEWEIREAVPKGMPSECLKLEVDKGYLHLHAKHSTDNSSYSFEKWVRLPRSADLDKLDQINASLDDNAVLSISIPKRQLVDDPTTQVRVIPIHTNNSSSSSSLALTHQDDSSSSPSSSSSSSPSSSVDEASCPSSSSSSSSSSVDEASCSSSSSSSCCSSSCHDVNESSSSSWSPSSSSSCVSSSSCDDCPAAHEEQSKILSDD